MNSTYDRKLLTDELNALNAKDLSAASEGERHITLTERNWTAVLRLLGRMCSTQDTILTTLDALLTRQDAEDLLGSIERTMNQFAEKAEDMNARFSANANALVRNTEKSLQSMESSTESTLREMVCKTNSQLQNLISSARKWMTRLGIVALLLLVALGTVCGIVMLRKLG